MTDLKIVTRIWNIVEKQGFSISIMCVVLWISYSMGEEQKRINEANNEQIRTEMQDCRNYSRDVLQTVVEENTLMMQRVHESIERLEDSQK